MEWTEAASCTWMHEASFLQSVLEAAGIETMIPNAYTIGVLPLHANVLGGIRILVPRADLERAREVLASAARADEAREGGDAV